MKALCDLISIHKMENIIWMKSSIKPYMNKKISNNFIKTNKEIANQIES